MKAALAWSLLLLAGSVSCNPVQEKANLPSWIIDNLPESWPESIPSLPEWVPELVWPPQDNDWWPEDGIDWGAIEWPTEKPDWFPVIDWEAITPEWWPGWEAIVDGISDITINRPVAGTPATIEEFPSIVQVEVGSGSIWAQGCAGSVLTSFHILTAARCVSGSVDRAVIHPAFGGTAENVGNIAVVRLLTSLVFSPSIQQASIISAGFNLPSGMPVVLAGWGSTAQGGKIANRDLHQIDLVSVSSDACSELWNRLIPTIDIKIAADNFCVARPETGGRDADLRDIGAPIYYQNILMGVVTFGAPFGNERFPTVATDVSRYTNWIVETAV
ncbi:Protease [Operophtera brumata]|uniref:Protease n=1 Tax=Operophtera brumata TaxID=104452 RepID=A0A0L7L171_OPEBR|nr:Protease [Operophtera brumata]